MTLRSFQLIRYSQSSIPPNINQAPSVCPKPPPSLTLETLHTVFMRDAGASTRSSLLSLLSVHVEIFYKENMDSFFAYKCITIFLLPFSV